MPRLNCRCGCSGAARTGRSIWISRSCSDLLYQTVLREASRPEDLTGYLDRDTLMALWPELHLPRGVRRAWEDHHSVLRAAAALPA